MNGRGVVTLDVCHSDVAHPSCRETIRGDGHHAYMGIAAQIEGVNAVVSRLHVWHCNPGLPCLRENLTEFVVFYCREVAVYWSCDQIEGLVM